MSEKIKFSEDELKQIANLQSKYEHTLFRMGETQIRRYMINEEIEKLKTIENELKEKYMGIQKEEEDILNELSNKYGEGELDIKTGTFTPKK